MASFEVRFAEGFGKRHCLLTGNGTTALTIAMRIAAKEKAHVLLPAMACYNTVMATYFAGKIPLFADITERDGTIDPHAVDKALRQNPDIGAVLIVHLFGHTAQTDEIVRICRKRDVVSIEDVAQALGGKDADGYALGSMGDISIFSFGHTKIINAGGGGALLTDQSSFHKTAQAMNSKLPRPSDKADMLMGVYRDLYYSLWAAGQTDERFYSLFDDFPLKFKELFLFRGSNHIGEMISNAIGSLDRSVQERHEIACIYQDELRDLNGVKFFNPRNGSVFWRYSLRIDPRIRNRVFDIVRGKGIDISGWYPCHSIWTASGRMQGKSLFPVAMKLEKEVVNLWVAEGYTPDKAIRTICEFKSAVKDSMGRL